MRETMAKLKHYRVIGHVIDDRPTYDGWYSAGRQVPTLYVSAFNPSHATEIAVAACAGWHANYDPTQVSLTVIEVDADTNATGEAKVHSTVRNIKRVVTS